MSNDNGTVVITGADKIEGARWLSVRMALKLEIRTGMKRSARGATTLQLANEITGKTTRSKTAAYDALNKKIAETFGADFDKPRDF